MNAVHVFSGPSLPPQVLAEIAPIAIWHPPARRGDLLRAGLVAGDALLLIDGYYGSVPATSHFELIELLALGVAVYGCSSMGALRAAELHMLGMIGMGMVFEHYRLGLIEGDDEVAVMHDPLSYELMSVPLVNVRLALHRRVLEQDVSARQVRFALADLGKMPFMQRSHSEVRRVLLQHGVRRPEAVFRVEADIKRLDAVNAARSLGAMVRRQMPAPTAFRKQLIKAVRRANTLE